ncbi:MAG: hypothetical protein ABIB97_01640 [Patescibacteria group bacterium]
MAESNNDTGKEDFDWQAFWAQKPQDTTEAACQLAEQCSASVIDAKLLKFRKALMTGTSSGNQTPENEQILNQAWKIREEAESKNNTSQ